jgi:Cellulose binding domain
MSWSMVRARSCAALTIWCALSGMGCASGEDETTESAGSPGSSERRGIGLELAVAKKSAAGEEGQGERSQALSSPVPFPLDDRRSLFVSDEAIVSQIKLGDVLAKIAGSSSGALALYKSFWSLQKAPKCQPLVNGFPNFCPALEANQANDVDPFDTKGLGLDNQEAYHAVALVNRVDLTSSTGADCGEFRIIFGKNPQVGPKTLSRALVIFEAVLPNPKPTLGLVGCVPSQTAWANLSNPALTTAERASALKTFFLDNIEGAPPVVLASNYTGGSSGRIRTNQFFQDQEFDPTFRPWVLREFRLTVGGNGTVTPSQVTTKENPYVGLFDNSRTDGIANDFVDYLSRQDVVRALAVNDLNRFSYGAALPDRFNAMVSQSSTFGLPSQNTPNDYTTTFAAGGPAHRLRTRLQTTLSSIGSPLTPEQVVARAQALSCAGCHLLSSEEQRRSLGLTNPDGSEHLFPPVSTPFTHIDERSKDANGRFVISAAVEEFLQFRHQVQQSFFERAASFPLSATIQVTDNWATGYCADIVLRNTSSRAFSVWQVNLTVSGATLQGPGWGGTFATAQSKWEVTPPTFGAPIGPGSVYKPRFCANKSVSGSAPQVTVTASLGYRP